MLSRLAFRSQLVQQLRPISVAKISDVIPKSIIIREISTDVAKQSKRLVPIIIKDGPERDLVNFPRQKPPIDPPKHRLGFIPETWFTFFYPKTGVTGPYVLLTGFTTYLLSKEIYVMEHEHYTALAILWVGFLMHRFGWPHVAAWQKKIWEEGEAEGDKFQADHMKAIESAIKDEQKSVWRAEGQKMLFEAKKENVQLLLEANYRERLMQVYSEVKRRMDYQVEILNAERRLQQRNMVNWIVTNVMKGITPQQEKEALQKCISDLKSLAAKA